MRKRVPIWQGMLILIICMACLVTQAVAGIELQLPEHMVLVAANHKNTKAYGKVSLPDGENQVVVQFQGPLARGHFDTDAEMGYSDVFVVKFRAAGQSLVMHIPSISGNLDLDKFNRTADIRILDVQGEAIHTRIAKLEKDGVQLFRDYAKELEAFNRSGSPAAVEPVRQMSSQQSAPAIPAKTLSPSQTSPPPEPASLPGQSSDNMAEKMLKYWYQQADEATRARFRHWISQ